MFQSPRKPLSTATASSAAFAATCVARMNLHSEHFRRLVISCLLWSSVGALKGTSGPSNHALILSSSRYWFNYRHVINALSIYQYIKSQGIPDGNIVLMLADEIPSNPRNPHKNAMYVAGAKRESLYEEDIEIDYRGEEVTVENLQHVFLGKGHRTLQTNQDSNILIYWTGHGGDKFFKFQDVEEITATDINRLFQEMFRLNKYNEILFIADTCQAFTLGDEITAPNVFMVGSSLRKENSYAHHSDPELGLGVIERYTHAVTGLLKAKGMDGMSLYDGLVGHLEYHEQRANVGYQGGHRKMSEVPMKDFFSNQRSEEARIDVMKCVPMTKESNIPQPYTQPEQSETQNLSRSFGKSSTIPLKRQLVARPTDRGFAAFDHAFLTLIMGLLGFVIFASFL